MSMHCQSCGMPLAGEMRSAGAQEYCRYCADESGKLLAREQVRADHYLRSMPAWAER